MSKVLLVLTMVVLLVSSAMATDDSTVVPSAPYYASVEEARAAVGDDRNIMIDFYTDWCKWCKMNDTVVFVNPKVIDFFTNEVALVKVNAEVDTALAKKYHISAYPTSVLITTSGDEIDRVHYEEPDTLLQTLRNYANGIGTLEDLLSKIDKEFDREMALKIAEKYGSRGGDDASVKWFQKVIKAGDPTDSLSGECRMSLARIPYGDKEYDTAIAAYEAVIKDFEGTYFAEQSTIWRGYIFKKKGDTSSAIAAFEDFVKQYPQSEDLEWVQGQISKLKGEEPKPEPKSEDEG